jgi:hypothetical protein
VKANCRTVAVRIAIIRWVAPAEGAAMADQDPVLSLRIAFDSPDPEVASAAAQRLRALGLEVPHVSARGVLVSGLRSAIERALDTKIDFKENIPQFVIEPAFGKLPSNTTYRAYFPRTPIYF